MNQLTQRQYQALKTKKKILKSALELFSKNGFNNVTIDEIAKNSGTSKGAFYVHFDSKYGVFLEKFKEIDQFYEEFTKSLPANISFNEKILSLFEGQMIYLQESLGKDLMRTVYMSGLIENEHNFFVNMERTLYKIIEGYIKEGIEQNELSSNLQIRRTSLLISRCMRGTLYDWLLFGEDYDLVQESDQFIRIFLNGLKK
ncbi:TetR family transcriptional regulator [Viridibacillus arvi]|uniref:TetR family transcriptional regulator n=1 Tax=Viridibacillus arvi TaxID=263475 RepID=UPI0036AE94BB